jgi:hypothetical protein
VTPGSVQIPHDGTAVSVSVAATCSNTANPSVSVTGLPTGVTVTVQQPDCNTSGKLTFAVTNAAQAPAAKYTAAIAGTSSAVSATTSANVEIVAQATVGNYYSSCNQKDTDTQLFNEVTTFVNHVKYFRQTMDANVATTDLPIWVTENNVNADWAKGDGTSACNVGQRWVEDKRGTSGYFAAWRPYIYSQLTKAGAAGLWHWSYPGGGQYGEMTDNGTKYLSYWVDYYLAHMFGEEKMNFIPTSVSEMNRVEILGAQKLDGTRVIMVVNRDVASAADNNGNGVPKTVTVDLSTVPFTTAELISINAATDLTNGPTKQTLTPSGGKVTLAFTAYGVQFIILK